MHCHRLACGLLLASIVFSGCSRSSPHDLHDPLALFDRYNSLQRRYDPLDFVELDLGEFYVTHNRPDSTRTLMVEFHLIGVVQKGYERELAAAAKRHQQSMRDAVISLVQAADVEQLTEPTLVIVRNEMVPAVSRALRTTALRDVVFTDFVLQ